MGKRFHRACDISYAAVCAAVMVGAGSAHATTSISSSAYGLYVNLSVAGLNPVLGPLAPAGGMAAPPYDVSNQLASVDETVGLGALGLTTFSEHLGTSLIKSNARSPFPPTPTGSAKNTVDTFSANLDGTTFGIPVTLFDIGARTITSSAKVTSLGAIGSSALEDLTITGTALGGLTIDGSLYAHAAPNTILFDAGGLEIILNEQTPSGDGVTSGGVMVNAIHAIFTDFALGTGLLNGDVIVSHSEAEILGVSAVPEPGTWAMMLLGVAGIGFSARRRARKVHTAAG